MQPKSHIAFIIQPPPPVVAYFDRWNLIVPDQVEGWLPPVSPPHLTLLYLPCHLLDCHRLRCAIEVLSAAAPVTVRYGGIVVSAYGTFQLGVQPQAALRQLHISLLSAIGLDAFLSAPAQCRLETFNTTNIGDMYCPHVTLGRFTTTTQAAAVAQSFNAQLEAEQHVSDIWLSDATHALDYRLKIALGGVHTNSIIAPKGVSKR